jgi:hypothetical protein
MSRPPRPSTFHPITGSSPPSVMTETQSPPNFPPSSLYGSHPFPPRHLPHPTPILPPLSIPVGPPQKVDLHFGRSPINQQPILPPIPSGPAPLQPPRHQPPPPPQRYSAAPVDKLLSQPTQPPYTPPRSDPPYSPQHYGPAISPRSDAPPRGVYERYPHGRYEDQRLVNPESNLVSPVDAGPKHNFNHLPSPGYTSSYTSSNHTIRDPTSHRSSAASSLGIPSYSDPTPPAQRTVQTASNATRPAPPPIVEKKYAPCVKKKGKKNASRSMLTKSSVLTNTVSLSDNSPSPHALADSAKGTDGSSILHRSFNCM